jgi:hypothetical protein
MSEDENSLPNTISHYRVLRKIGKGGMGDGKSDPCSYGLLLDLHLLCPVLIYFGGRLECKMRLLSAKADCDEAFARKWCVYV